MNYPVPQPQQQFPPAYPQQPMPQAYPQQPAYPAYQQPFPGMQAPPAAPPQQPLASGTIDDYYNQPSTGGGASLKFDAVGTRYVGTISRPLTNGDIQQQTDRNGRGLTFRDGRPKFVMKVPLVLPAADGTQIEATWWCKGQARDELTRAMAEAGAPAGPPEHGATLDITFTGEKQSGAGYNPSKVFHITYTRPNGAAPAAPQAAPQAVAPAPQPVQQAVPMQAPVPVAAPQAQPVPQMAPAVPQQVAPVPVTQAPVPQAPAQPAPVAAAPAPANLSPEQAELLARLTGQQPA